MNYLRRIDWGLQGPLGIPLKPEKVRGIWLHHTVTRPTDDPIADARVVNRIGVERFGRLSYSWMVHPDGTVIEGQAGHLGVHTKGQNSTTEAICAIGNYETGVPSEAMVGAIVELLASLPVPLLGGHRDAPGARTACPGTNLHRLIPLIMSRVADEKRKPEAEERLREFGRQAATRYAEASAPRPAPEQVRRGSHGGKVRSSRRGS